MRSSRTSTEMKSFGGLKQVNGHGPCRSNDSGVYPSRGGDERDGRMEHNVCQEYGSDGQVYDILVNQGEQ